MDWGAIASILAERTIEPVVLLDHTGRIRMFNHAMEQALGWTRFQVEGQVWARMCVPPEHHDEAQRWIAEAFRGALRSYDAITLAQSGARVVFRFEFALVGRGTNQGLLVTAVGSSPAPATIHGSLDGQDLDYEVSLANNELGAMTRLHASGGPIPLTQPVRCFALLHGRERQCDECPLFPIGEAPWPRTSVQHRSPDGGARVFEIKTADLIEDARARVRLRILPETMLETIQAAKVHQLAEHAALSPREREVLSYLLLGRNVEDIAQVIGISIRTVKYHQANVLTKLGAESRVDLFRLLF